MIRLTMLCACLIAMPAVRAAVGQGRTAEDLMDLTNPRAAISVTVKTEDGRTGYVAGERFKLLFTASDDCYLIVLERDPDGEVYLLAPSAATKQATESDGVRLRKGQTLVVPGGEAAFRAQPPHGASLIKAIVTTKPLDVKEFKARADSPPVRLGRTGTSKLRELSAKVSKAIGVDVEEGSLQRRGWATAKLTIVTGSDKADLERRTEADPDETGSPVPAPPEELPRSAP